MEYKMITTIRRCWYTGIGALADGLYKIVKREKRRAENARSAKKDTELDDEYKSRRAEKAAKVESANTCHEWVRHNRNFD